MEKKAKRRIMREIGWGIVAWILIVVVQRAVVWLFPETDWVWMFLAPFIALMFLHYYMDTRKARWYGTAVGDKMKRCELRKGFKGMDPCAMCKQGYACAKGAEDIR